MLISPHHDRLCPQDPMLYQYFDLFYSDIYRVVTSGDIRLALPNNTREHPTTIPHIKVPHVARQPCFPETTPFVLTLPPDAMHTQLKAFSSAYDFRSQVTELTRRFFSSSGLRTDSGFRGDKNLSPRDAQAALVDKPTLDG